MPTAERLPGGLRIDGPVALEGEGPSPDVSAIPGAHVALSRTLAFAGRGTGRLVCVEAPSSRWVEGLEGVVFERAAGLVVAADPAFVWRFDGPARVGLAWEQHGTATGTGAAPTTGAARLVFGFAGSEATAVACAATCASPEPGCADHVASLRYEGFVPPPPPGLALRALRAALDHPSAALLVGALVAALVVAGLVVRRPYPRP